LPAGTVVNLDLITDNTYAQTLLTGTNNYILSLAVSWLALDETVPDTTSGTSISLTITNPSIRAGALIYSVQNGVATLLGTATANNTLTVQLTADPSIYVVSTVPSLPRAITSTVTSNSATLTWTAPVSDGGATISGYTMTLNTGAVCTTLTLTCTFNNLTAGTTYTATIVATNTLGSSVSATSSFTLTTPVVVPPVVVPPVVVPPVVVPPVVVPPVVPPAIVVIPVVTAVEKVLANNVPVLTGTRVVTPVIFNADSARLDSTDMAQIRRAAAALEGKTGWLLITGFVKYTGKMTPKIRALASSRAKNVANAFLRMGVKVQIGYLGYGPKNTKSPQNNDRKVEIRWIDKPTLNG
jgi:outer membrane protein OmpA-like peptidoglycan-associated protein